MDSVRHEPKRTSNAVGRSESCKEPQQRKQTRERKKHSDPNLTSKSKPGTTSSPAKSSPTKPRPATESAASKNDHGNEIGSPNSGAVKNGKEKAAPASGLTNGSPGAALPSKSAASGPRKSTSRVSSAKKTETGTGSTSGSRSASRLLPPTNLYRPTASSALKGMSSSSATNRSSNHSLLSSPSTPRTPGSFTDARASRSSNTTGAGPRKSLPKKSQLPAPTISKKSSRKSQVESTANKKRGLKVIPEYTRRCYRKRNPDLPGNIPPTYTQFSDDEFISNLLWTCPCKLDQNDDDLWIECSGCSQWFHRVCAKLSIEELSALGHNTCTWLCFKCSENILTQNSDDALTDKVECEYCHQLYKRSGLKIHITKAHKNEAPAEIPVTCQDFGTLLDKYKQNIKILRRIPKNARPAVAFKLTELLNTCVDSNQIENWHDLLLFPFKALYLPSKSTKSLTSIVKTNTKTFKIPSSRSPLGQNSSSDLLKRVEAKVADGDISGAIKILSSSDSLVPVSEDTLKILESKHPCPSRDLNWPLISEEVPVQVTVDDIVLAINSFCKGSAGGLDGLKPQHLKDLCNQKGHSGSKLLEALTRFINFLLEGRVPPNICPILYGAALCALSKKDGGVRPIAVGCVYRRLTAKVACKSVFETTGNFLRPHQLGFATRGGCESAIHAVRAFCACKENSDKVFLKLDVKNAFNSLERDVILNNVKEHTPGLFPFLYQCYRYPSNLYYGSYVISSQRGAQQGDPCGPLIFSLGVHTSILSCKSELNSWYLDDGGIGGTPDDVAADFITITEKFKSLGLEMNTSKCELYFVGIKNQAIIHQFEKICPDIKVVDDDISLLGSPINDSAIPEVLDTKLKECQLLSSRLVGLKTQIAFFLLRNCVFLPKLIYFLRTCPTFKFQNSLHDFDDIFRLPLEQILNVTITDHQWMIATLPIAFGGLGVRKLQDLSLPAYISSLESTVDLVQILYPNTPDLSTFEPYVEAVSKWNQLNDNTRPESFGIQKDFDIINVKRIIDLIPFESDVQKAKFESNKRNEASAWLHTLPSKSLDTLMDNNSFRISIALRLGSPVCAKHICICGEVVDEFGLHGLSCRKVSGRNYRHRRINDVIKRAIISTDTPAVLEPAGLCRSDGKRPDGMSLVPWNNGQCLVWDFTCSDSLAESYKEHFLKGVGRVANFAAKKKINKYKDISAQGYLFVPFAVETLGPWCDEAIELIDTIGKRFKLTSSDVRSKSFLIQRISLEIQRGNAACIMSTCPDSIPMDEIFYLL